jgi:hypothetical protein
VITIAFEKLRLITKLSVYKKENDMKNNNLGVIAHRDILRGRRPKEQNKTHPIAILDAFLKSRKNDYTSPMNITCKLGPETGRINSIWINKVGNRVVGLARLVQDAPQSACIVLFRIDPEWRHTKITSDMINSIQQFCQEHGTLNVRILPHVAPPWMFAIMKQHGIRREEMSRAVK